MKANISILLLLLSTTITFAQNKNISGLVVDGLNGEKLVNAHIVSTDLHIGTVTDNQGFFNLNVNIKSDSIIVSYVGYEPTKVAINNLTDTFIFIKLTAQNELHEIKINAPVTAKFKNCAILDIPIKQIKSVPSFLGETDLFKTLQMLPGVQNTKDGFVGLVVRGGEPDQNLVLLDNVPVYGYSHYFGLFSIFNEGALSSVRFMKSLIPAKYGGRLSSVVDITLKEGNKTKKESEISIGLVSGQFNINGPLKNKKTTYLLSARRTLIDAIYWPINYIVNKQQSGYYFGDISAKLTHNFSKKEKLSLSMFFSKDRQYEIPRKKTYKTDGNNFELSRSSGHKWGNRVISLNWDKILSSKFTVNSSLYHSGFYFNWQSSDSQKFGDKNIFTKLNFHSNIKDLGIKSEFKYYPSNNHNLSFGFNVLNHQFKTGIKTFNSNGSDDSKTDNSPENIFELSGFVEYNIYIGSFLSLSSGGRLTTLLTNKQTFVIPEPRFSTTIYLNKQSRITFFYTQTSQYFHLLRSSTLDLPTDLWVAASNRFRPEIAKQFGAEIFVDLNSKINISTAIYSKKMDNLIEYKEGSSIFSTKTEWQDKVEIGKGKSYGAEFFIHKKTGRLNGWASYSISWSKRQFNNINNGNWYFSTFDKRHYLSVTTSYQLTKKWKIGATWEFHTGTPYNYPEFAVNGSSIVIDESTSTPGKIAGFSDRLIYVNRNNYRLPAYHRLDIGAHHSKPQKKHPNRIRTWSFSIYNAYNRSNPFFRGYIYGPAQASLFGIMPSISYKLKFN